MSSQKKLKFIITLFIVFVSNELRAQDTLYVIQDTTYVIQDTARIIGEYNPATWQYAATNTSNDKWYIYKKYLGKENNQIKIWVKLTMDTTTFKKRLYRKPYELKLLVIDCSNNKFKQLASTLYNSSGLVIDVFDDQYSQFQYVTPESALEAVVERICALYN